MKIAIDIDDVLTDTVTPLSAFFNRVYGGNIKKEDLEGQAYWSFLGQTREEANEKYFAFSAAPEFDLTLPQPGSVEAVKKLNEKNELYLITGRPYFLKTKTEEWVQNYFPNQFEGVYFTNDRLDKDDFSPYWGRKKAVICDEIGATVLIDDLFDYIEGTGHLRVILLDQPWNRVDSDIKVERASSWENIVKLLG
jgi:5'(3')-deoxyribonucleotidase